MERGVERKIIVETPLPVATVDKQTDISDDDEGSGEEELEEAGGMKKEPAREHKGFDPHYYGLAVDKDFIYYTDWKNW